MQEFRLPGRARVLLLASATGLLALGALGLVVSPGEAQEAREVEVSGTPMAESVADLEIREWDVPWEDTRPGDPYRAPDGTVHFAGRDGDYIGHLDPETGEMRRFELPEGSSPHGVIVDTEGHVWYAGHGTAHLGRLDPATGEVLRYGLPEAIEGPHSLAWSSSGEIWFTAERSGTAGFIGRFSPESGEVRAAGVPGSGLRPHGIVMDSGDRPWVAFAGTNAIGTVDPETMEVEVVETSNSDSRIRRIGVTSDDRVWFVDGEGGWLGMYDPATEAQEEWLTPGGEAAGLHALAVDDLDRIWYVEAGMEPNRFIGFDPATEEFIAVDEVPSGGGDIRQMVYSPQDGALWFGTDAHTIGRAVVPR